jgi:hypothetical protein
MFKTAIVAMAAAAVTASGASAAVLFSQDFNALPQGIPALSVPGFTITTGTVDVVTSGNFGITCIGNTGACLDIDGSPGPGALSTTPIAFASGKRVTVSFDVSGNQRVETADIFQFSFGFGAPTDMLNFQCISGITPCASGNFFNFVSSGVFGPNIPGLSGWQTYAFSFVPGQAGTIQLNFSSPSTDNIGPLLDNVLVSQVPEPASWALLIAGFGLTGAVMRRRRMAVAA